MKRRSTILLAVMASFCIGNVSVAQENPRVDLRIEARGDLQNELIDGNVVDANTGFRGKQLNLRLNGNINDS